VLAAIYCRVSTAAQAEDGTSLDSQREACLSLAAERGYAVPSEHVLREDWTGADLERPKLDRIRELIRSQTIQALVCYAVDRLARDPIHVGIIAEECAKRDVELLFVLEPLDNSPEGALIRYVKGYAAQIERERIKERTLRGKRTRARMGFLVQGAGRGIYGYQYVPQTKRRAINEAEAQVVRRIFSACVQGVSCYSIAVSLNADGIPAFGGGPWHPRTISRMLRNPSYKGATVFGRTRRVSLGGKRRRLEERRPEEWIEIPGATPPIVTEELFASAQEVLSQPRRNPKSGSRKYLLIGHLECTCGRPAVGTCLNRSYRYYRCRSTWPTTIRPRTCDEPYIRADRLEETVWSAVREVLEDPEVVIAEIKRQQPESSFVEDEIARIQGLIRRLGDQERRLIRLFGTGGVTEEYVLREIDQVKKSREALQRDLSDLEQQRQRVMELDGLSERVRSYCAQVAERLDNFDFDEKRLALDALQIKVAVDSGGASLKGAIPYDLATIGRTSASRRARSGRRRWGGLRPDSKGSSSPARLRSRRPAPEARPGGTCC
jgi:site-specific DNA recombinase